MTTLTMAELSAIEARHPDLMKPRFWSVYRIPIAAVTIALYFLFCWWFFAIGHVLSTSNWGIASIYLADWVSYEERPDIDIAADGTMQVKWGRYDPIGPNPDPDWLVTETKTVTRTIETGGSAEAAPAQPKSSFSFVAPVNRGTADAETAEKTETRTETVVSHALVQMSRTSAIDVSPPEVMVTHGDQRLQLKFGADGSVTPSGALPDWATQRAPGEKVVVSFGFPGWAEIRSDAIKVHKRYFGWENFFFDIDSRLFGKSWGQIARLIWSGDRLDPAQSNLSLAINDFLYNPSWQHLDVWSKLLQTVVMAFVGTLLASLIAFPLAFIAARNITRNKPLNQVTKRFFDFQRSVDMFIWALFFTRAFGPGPLAGIAAIFFTDTGTLGKLYAEALENIDDKQREGVKSVGASPLSIQRFGVLPQVLPVFASQALYFWESNTRSATIIGAVGAGGIGLKLWEAMRTNQDWENVGYMVVLILIVVFVFDTLSNALRSRLMGTRKRS
ncbi:phosphonate ABC transporter, permease protein PhnE [Rhizobium halophytocola]|uniref:Phosphonate transport system permease protein n=1 Tax=Rhizobium halophytocola TaxID=735519 RepID=A0ABS4E174_9HYPH|nr:phosphonate ABC transporter, permease protein PhnE [Rhizobium halophytocola]MBP1851693.1 phosphonate transport system permease protein [Rhizobium halophytocola]